MVTFIIRKYANTVIFPGCLASKCLCTEWPPNLGIFLSVLLFMMVLKLMIIIGQISQALKKKKQNSNQMFYFQIFQ